MFYQANGKGGFDMAIRFMSGTPDEELEIIMQRVPGFQPRRSGMIVSRLGYNARDCDCSLCEYADKKENACKVLGGRVCLRERIVAGCVPFSELLELLIDEVDVKPFVARVTRLSGEIPPFFFLTGHRERFDSLWCRHSRVADEDAMCAALYLLSADRFLWGKSVAAIQPDIIRFKEIQIHGVDLGGYVLFHTAKDLYRGTKHISLSELTDPELVSDETFRLVIASFLIRRHGAGVLEAEGSCR